jgi:hypothetical protein
MQSLKKITSLFTRLNVRAPVYGFAADNWKDRDEAAEKVYITQAESKKMSM